MALLILLLILSVVLLYYGAELSLDSAERIGFYLGLSPLVIGLLIVGFGTSLPEFFVSHLATFRGRPELALGNIVGSNVANIFLILGVTGLFTRLIISGKDLFTQFIWHILITVCYSLVLYFKTIGIYVGILSLGIFVSYLYFTLVKLKEHHQRSLDDVEGKQEVMFFIIAKLVLGIGLLYGGGELLVHSGSNLARSFGVSDYLISVVFVAFGTSFPELVTAILACVKKKNTDLITGNIIGSNIFNLTFVLGSLSVHGVTISRTFYVEIASLMFAAIFFIILNRVKLTFYKYSGALFLLIYSGMIYYWFVK
jgi:cation:H+ antiporter